MKRLSSWALPMILGLVGVALIIFGTIGPNEPPATSLPPIAQPSDTPVPTVPAPTVASTDPGAPSPTETAEPTDAPTEEPTPTPTAIPDSVVAVQLEVPSVGINVVVRQSTSADTDGFPPTDAAYILRSSSQPGRNANSYIFAHAINTLFKPLWNARIGDEVLVRMSDNSVLRYTITEVRPNVACPDPNADPALNPADPPLALQIHGDCSDGAFWTAGTQHERLTLQTSQGYNRNWGELVIVAEPAR